MFYRRHRAGFSEKPGACIVILCQARGDQFDSHPPVELEIVGQVDRAHPSSPKLAQHTIALDDRERRSGADDSGRLAPFKRARERRHRKGIALRAFCRVSGEDSATLRAARLLDHYGFSREESAGKPTMRESRR